MDNNELLTCKEAAEMLRCNWMTVQRYIKKKIIPGFRISNRWRIRRSDIQAFIDNGGYAIAMGPKKRSGKKSDFVV